MRLCGPKVTRALVTLALLLPGVAWGDEAGELDKAHGAYVAHKYDEAEARLRTLLDPATGAIKDSDNLADARMYLGAVLVAQGRPADADAQFEQLLLDKPDYQPDPLRVALPAIDAFIDTRTRVREKLAAMQAESVRRAQEERARLEAQRQLSARHLALVEKLARQEVVVRSNSRWVALLPFGVGQFQNGQEGWGWVFLASESMLAVGSVVGAVVSVYDEAQRNDATLRNDGTAGAYTQRAQIAAVTGDLFAAGFYAVAMAGVLQAQIAFVPERVRIRKREPQELTWRPVLAPGGIGVVGSF